MRACTRTPSSSSPSPLLSSPSRLSRYAPDRASLLPFNTCSNKQGVEVENLRNSLYGFFSSSRRNEGKTRLGGSGFRSEGRKEGRERKIWKRCFGGFRAVASCSSSSSSSCLLMPRTSIDFTLRSEIMILTYASCR